jgi:hypothetical protein
MEHASLPILILTLLFAGAILWQIRRARSGRSIHLRRIAGLDVMDDAIGRATEMNRPVMFNLGLDDLSVHLFCSLASMSYVVREAARLQMRVLVPVTKPVAYPLAEEYWKEAYAQAGQPNLYRADECLRFMSTDQAAFGVSTAGWIQRERVGANFIFGGYGFESLVIAEAGQRAGAIQVACTHSFYQVPFFIAACDYTAFGEEFFAAGAYFSRDPVLTGSLAGQDIAKMIILVLIVVGSILATVMVGGGYNPLELLLTWR